MSEHSDQASLRYPPSARFGRLGFLDIFFCEHRILSDFLHPIFTNKKLKMHLRELSREFPVPKTARLLMRARFLRAVPSYHGFSFFFLERLSSFFLKRRKKDAEKNMFKLYPLFPS
jgi:hypothetical protein